GVYNRSPFPHRASTRRRATQLGGLPHVLQLPLKSIEPSPLSAPAALASACRFVISGLRILCLKTSFVTAPVSAYNASTLVKLKRLRTSAYARNSRPPAWKRFVSSGSRVVVVCRLTWLLCSVASLYDFVD